MPTAKKTTLSKSDFIREQPATMPVAEVVAKGNALGIKFSSQLVYYVRGLAKKKPTKAVAPATKPAVKKTPTPSKAATPTKSPPTTTKAAFVRARLHLSPKEIVEDAKAAGLELDTSYVYNVRGYDAAKKRATKQPTRARKGVAVPRPVATTSKAQDLLIAVAAEIGLGRAMEILEAERARVRSVIGG